LRISSWSSVSSKFIPPPGTGKSPLISSGTGALAFR
jgi:hypothetical protein